MSAQQVVFDAIYEPPFVYCERCKGVGQDYNIDFWCSLCKGEGTVPDPDEDVVTSIRDEAWGIAETAVKALTDAGYKLVPPPLTDEDGNEYAQVLS